LFTPNVPVFIKQYNLVPCEGLLAKAPYLWQRHRVQWTRGYCRAVLRWFCWIAKNRDINRLLYFQFTHRRRNSTVELSCVGVASAVCIKLKINA